MNWTQRASLVWAGLVIGGGFIAAPAKFTVQGIDMPHLLMIGHVTFHWMVIVEIILAGIGVMAMIWRHRISIPFILAIFLLTIQWTWIMPPLDAQTQKVIEGGQPDMGNLHVVFAAVATAKLLSLIAGGIFGDVKGKKKQPAAVEAPAKPA